MIILRMSFAIDEKTYASLLDKILSGQPIPDWIIDSMLSRPAYEQQDDANYVQRERDYLMQIRKQNTHQTQQEELATEQRHLDFASNLNNTDKIREFLHSTAIPPSFRQAIWPIKAKPFLQEAINFLSFEDTETFMNKLEQLKGEEFQDICFKQLPETPSESPINAIVFVKTRPIILNDINRTLKSTNLFAEDEPLFEQLCQLVSCCAVYINNYIQGLSLAAGVILMHLRDIQASLAVMFRIMNSRIYENFLVLNEQRLNCYAVYVFKAIMRSFSNKKIVQLFKLQKMQLGHIQEELQNNLYDVLIGSLAGLVLSLFAKQGATFSANVLDLISTAEDVHEAMFEVAIAFFVTASAKFLVHNDQELLIVELTKQGNEPEEFCEIIRRVYWLISGEFEEELAGLQRLVGLV